MIPVPDPVPLPAPQGLLWFLLMLTFLLHILAMNFVLGGSIIAAAARLRGRGESQGHAIELVRCFTKAAPVMIAATITTGVAPLLFLQALYGRLFFVSAILMGWFWLAVIPLLIVAYYLSYWSAFRNAGGRLPALVMTLIFVAIAFIYSNNMSLMLRPDVFRQSYLAEGRGLWLNLADPTLWPRYLHFLLGATAVAGMVVALLGLWRRSSQPEFGRWAMRHGSLWFALPTTLNLLAGAAWLMTLPRPSLLRFMGGSPAAMGVLAAGVLLGLVTLVMMLMAVNARQPAGLIKISAATLLLTLVSMILVRDQVRRGALEAAGFEPAGWVVPQWGPMAIFAVLLVAAIVIVAWMTRQLMPAR